MKILATKLEESVLCIMPSGEHIEITMLCAFGEEVAADPDVKRAITLLFKYPYHFYEPI